MQIKYLSNFWETLEMLLINCETNLILTCSENCAISSATGATKFKITDAKIYASAVTLLTQNKAKLLQQLKPGFKRIINWNKYQQKVSTERQSFQGVNRLFVLSFWNENDRKVHSGFYLPKVEMKDYNVMIDGKNFFDLPVKSDIRIYYNIQKLGTSQGNDYATVRLLQ